MILIGKTDTGRVRSSNQDCFALQELPDDRSFAVVCDGMGGYKGGNIASDISVRSVKETLSGLLAAPLSEDSAKAAVTDAVNKANSLVFAASLRDETLVNMGTTIVVVYIADGLIHVAHVGDSRAYLYRDGSLSRITHDHSLVQMMLDSGSITPEEARVHPYKNVITRVVGKDTPPEISFSVYTALPGDIILICSDGLSNMLSDGEISAVLAEDSPVSDSTCDKLIELANNNGGQDNITAVLMQI